jgi:hypothetical protein
MATDPSEFIVFYSWQSDLPDATNRQAIRSGLRVASNKLESENSTVRVIIDEATRGAPGSPNIPATIMEKIRSCDVFVCDITTINSGAATEFRRVPNPNVAFELGYAVANVGWPRIIMVFNEASASVKEAPFDIDRHRILPYKIESSDPKNKSNHAQLSASLSAAIASIAAHQPPKPISGVAQSPEQVRRSRDIANLKWLLSNVHFPSLDQMIEALPDLMHSRVLHFWEGFNAVVKNSLFHLYDAELLTTVKSMHKSWGICVSNGEQYHMATNPNIYVFKNSGDAPLTQRQERVWKTINSARASLLEAQQALLAAIRERYLEIDVNETNQAAWQEYKDMQRDIEQQFERGEA